MTVTRSVQILQEKGNAMPIKEAIRTQRVPVRIWTDDIDEGSKAQLANIASLPFMGSAHETEKIVR